MTATTNREQPFAPGEVICYAGELYRVLANFGDSGRVQEYPAGTEIGCFYWRFDGEECRRVERGRAKR